MKIALIRRRYVDHGGAERYLAEVARILSKEGHAVHLLAHSWRPGDGIVLHRVAMTPGPGVLRLLSFDRNVERIVERERFDRVFSFERVRTFDLFRAGDGCHAAWLSRRPDQGLSRLLRSVSPHHRALLALEREIFERAKRGRIVANSQMVKEEIMRIYGVPPERIAVVYNGVGPDRFSPRVRSALRDEARKRLGLGPRDRLLLFVGSGFARKGLGRAIKILASLPENFRLAIVGKGKIPSVGSNARLIAAGPDPNPEPWYAAADLFLLPTYYDPCSNATLEAMAMGLPVLTTRANGAAELLPSECVLDEPDDPEEGARRVRYLAENGGEIGESLNRIALGLTLQESARRMVALLEGI